MSPEEVFTRLREALAADPHGALYGEPDFAIRDPALVDPVLRRVLERGFRGTLPADPEGVARVARRAQGSYRNLIDDEAGRAEVERHIQARYASPRLSWEGGLLVADHGVAPGRLERLGRAGWAVLRSEVVERGEWAGPEAAAALQRLVEASPQARAVCARLLVPTGTSRARYDYRWILPQDRLVVTRDTASNFAWVLPRVGGDLGPWRRGERSLHTADLDRTSLTRKAMGFDPDAPL